MSALGSTSVSPSLHLQPEMEHSVRDMGTPASAVDRKLTEGHDSAR
eukprot:CAMPEP_0184404280 /NCGR_PEP_ID=MMETSP0007-20130409/85855_1 /TAXON_ID=97485 /ORGANISM="Prymnesium parvum, Strain Texoma1" /LENGTH=45 /DNA_ID= /DNA_START= /DNA_END= /DNA_ORIENTATION=